MTKSTNNISAATLLLVLVLRHQAVDTKTLEFKECGMKQVRAQDLIIGGTATKQSEYPWVVAIYKDNKYICAGSILSRRYILSAAHCFTHLTTGKVQNKNDYIVTAGKHYIEINDSRDADTQQIRKVDRIIVHEKYYGRYQNYWNDIALVEVEYFNFNLHVQPVCVDWDQTYDENSLKVGNSGVVVSWRFVEKDGKFADKMKKVIVPIQSVAFCKQHLPPDFFQTFYTHDKLCAGNINNNNNICHSSGGGGYYFQSNGQYFIRGIVSLAPLADFGCNQNQLALYTKVSLYNKWLAQVIGRSI